MDNSEHRFIITFWSQDADKSYTMGFFGDCKLGYLENLASARKAANDWLAKNSSFHDFTIQNLSDWFEGCKRVN